MKEKGYKNAKFVKYLDFAFIIVILISLFLPYANYTYGGTEYVLQGFRFLTGAIVAGGSCVIQPSVLLYIGIVLPAVALAAMFHAKKREPKTTGIIFIVTGLMVLVLSIVLNVKMEGLFTGVKEAQTAVGVHLLMFAAILMIAKGVRVLWVKAAVSALDFMVLPGMIYFIINNYIPMAGLLLAFKNIDFSVGIFASEWVGFENFIFLKNDLFVITRNTLLYNLAFIVVGNFFGIIVGVFLSEVAFSKIRRFSQSAILLPNLISMVIISYIVYGFLSSETGWINNQLLDEKNAVNFYMTLSPWPFILILVNTWKGLGYNSIIYLSSIIGIDRSIYEAAIVDGCGKWQQFKKITLPMLKPTITTLVLLSVGRIFFSDFGLFYQIPMNSGILSPVTQTIDTYVYRALTNTSSLSRAAAAGAFQSVVGFITILTVNQVVRKVDRENALF